VRVQLERKAHDGARVALFELSNHLSSTQMPWS
jgi:hypothetical protein